MQLSQLLLQKGWLTEDQLAAAQTQQKDSGEKLSEIILKNQWVSEEQLLAALSEKMKVPAVNLNDHAFDSEASALIPENTARTLKTVVLSVDSKCINVGMTDPTDIFAIDKISQLLKRPVKSHLILESQFTQSLEKLYKHSAILDKIVENFTNKLEKQTDEESDLSLEIQNEEDAPVVQLLESLLLTALKSNASDIHIEPEKDTLRIRHRIDGQLQEQIIYDNRIAAALTIKLKLMAKLNITEKRLPQDGRFNLQIKKKNLEIRLSTLPTNYGESVVMRLLSQSGQVLDLEKSAISPEMVQRIRSIVSRPHGMFLVTGPTGSGKTTTLYSILNELNAPTRKIITVEDPIEYRLPRVTQVQVNAKIDLTFANVLRSILRQDPDVIMVGEIRDQATAEIALRASMTGHLVLATLHTNDAAITAMRLIDMGVESFVVASALNAVMAQRLIRRLCPHCAQPADPTPQQLALFLLKTKTRSPEISANLKKAGGCEKCRNTGYLGRIPIHELLEIDSHLADALRTADPRRFMQAISETKSFKPLVLSALELANQGLTTLDEVVRVAGELSGNE